MDNRQEIENFSTTFFALEKEMQKAVIGQKELTRNVLAAMIAGGNVLLEGMPGLGKTQLVKAVGQVLDLQFKRIQFTPDLMPADVTGTTILSKQTSEEGIFRFEKGPIFSNIVLADEINRATPKTQSALLEAMQEATVTVGGNTYALPNPFFVLATQNPLEMEGTYPLPEAQMDRFLFKLDVSFPTKEELCQIVTMTTGGEVIPLTKICSGSDLLRLREIAKSVPIAKPVLDYIMELILKTHPEYASAPESIKQFVRYGASPRGAQAVLAASRIFALIAGRYNVSYDDVKLVAPACLRHRIFLNFEGIAEEMTPDKLISELISGDSHE